MSGRIGWALGAAAALSACAVNLGGPKPIDYNALAIDVGAGTTAAQAAASVKQAGANLVLVSATADSAWFAELARQTGLVLSGPGRADSLGLAFLAAKPVGDTTATLAVANAAPVTLHDALYQPQKERYLDLLEVHIPGGSAHDVAQALLRYVASDVMSASAVVLAMTSPDPALADSVATLIRPAFLDARDCMKKRASTSAVRLMYGPETRTRCTDAEVVAIPWTGAAVSAQLVVAR